MKKLLFIALVLFAGCEKSGLVTPDNERPTGMAIGALYEGGVIAYIFQPGDPGYIAGQTHGLIAAEMDQATGATSSNQSKGVWGCSETVAVQGADGVALGTGSQNTIDIVSGCSTPDIAARICADLVLNGKSDWYLPSLEELNKLYLNMDAIGNFTGEYYWSSSEAQNSGGNPLPPSAYAFRQLFLNIQTGKPDGRQNLGAKHVAQSVRAIRSF